MRDTRLGRIPASTQPTSEQILPLSARFAICDSAHEPSITIVDPKLRQAVRAAIEMKPFRYNLQKNAIDFSVMFQYPPTAFNFKMIVRSARTDELLCMLENNGCSAHSQSGMAGAFNLPGEITDKVKVIYEPDITSARQHVENDPIWGESVTFSGLTIESPTTHP